MDIDHLDVYSDAASLQDAYGEFASQVKGSLFVEKRIPLKGITYSVTEAADFYIDGIKPDASGSYFDLHTPDGVYRNQFFNQLGMHNLSNALVALAMASKAGLPVEDLAESLASFPGVQRSLQILINEKDRVLIDDYAHHPTEIKAVYETLKLSFPADKKCVVFQPHLFSRTQDFMTDFATVLSLFDRVLLLDIYPARELPIEGVSSAVLKEMISGPSVELITKKELANTLSLVDERIIVLLGAGDIGEEVEGIKHKLSYDEAL
jgi:UDP-N-acetylmuramate--alanine ligase